jgi:hypothetical protein
MLAGHYSQDVIAVKSGNYQLFIRITSEATFDARYALLRLQFFRSLSSA